METPEETRARLQAWYAKRGPETPEQEVARLARMKAWRAEQDNLAAQIYSQAARNGEPIVSSERPRGKKS